MINIDVIASTNGGVLGNLLETHFFRERIRKVVSDRQCGAIEVAKNFGIPVTLIETTSGLRFSEILLEKCKNDPPDLFVSFYTRLFRGDFLSFAKNKLINLHPSILPACPGLDGFGDTVKSGSRFIGATVHFVDSGIDTGRPIIQSVAPFNPEISIIENRHLVFVQQCKMLLQVIKWAEDKRIKVTENGCPNVLHASYATGEFSPNLDFDEAIKFSRLATKLL